MSDFFSNLYGGGVRKPDVVMNGGPLPPMSTSGPGYPTGFNGAPDGRINFASSLLGDVNPYSYAEADRLSTQTAYLNIPHRVQRIIPSLDLPEAQLFTQGGQTFRLSHQLDDGDIGFVIRSMFSPYDLVQDKKKFNRQGVLFAVDPVANMATVNYILHGLQRYGFDKEQKHWNRLWIGLGLEHLRYKDGNPLMESMMEAKNGKKHEEISEQRKYLAMHIIQNIIRPFGIPLGSEKQGGQHQGSNSASTWPVDFVTTMTIDGLVINMVNIWRGHDISSGDDLMLYLKKCSFTEYVLSHHSKNCRKQNFPQLERWKTEYMTSIPEAIEYPEGTEAAEFHYDGGDYVMTGALEGTDSSSKSNKPPKGAAAKEEHEHIFQLFPGTCSSLDDKDKSIRDAIWKDGYWHIARSQVCLPCLFSLIVHAHTYTHMHKDMLTTKTCTRADDALQVRFTCGHPQWNACRCQGQVAAGHLPASVGGWA